jgi:hypothetical protein
MLVSSSVRGNPTGRPINAGIAGAEGLGRYETLPGAAGRPDAILREGAVEIPERDTHATAKERRVEADGLPLRYLVAGEGPPLVLLHGAGDNSLDWRWVLPALARTHRVYALDMPGSPDSARPVADYSPAFLERSLAAFLDALGIERATLVGNSLGSPAPGALGTVAR